MRPSLLLFLVVLFSALPALHAADAPPIVGAIRWDGWYGDGSVTKAVEASLGQPKYHFRLPWFARVVSEGKVSINGDSQVIMDQEIGYAAQAGLNYWVFLDYLDEAPGMSIGLNRYLAAKDKKGIRYCLVEEGARLDKAGVKAWSRLVDHFRHPDYQTVLDGRPLLCLFGKTAKLGNAEDCLAIRYLAENRPDDDASDDFAEHSRDLDALEQFGSQFGNNQDDCQVGKNCTEINGPGRGEQRVVHQEISI